MLYIAKSSVVLFLYLPHIQVKEGLVNGVDFFVLKEYDTGVVRHAIITGVINEYH